MNRLLQLECEKEINVTYKSRDLEYAPYPLMLKFEILHNVLKDHEGSHYCREEIEKRSEQFAV